MLSEYDERVLDYQKFNHAKYIVKLKNDDALQDEVKRVNALPLQLAAFILSNKKRIMNIFKHANYGFYTNDNYYTDTDSLYIENKHWNNFDNAGLCGKEPLQGKNDFKDGGIFHGLFCSTINKFGVIDEHKTFQ